MRLHSLMGARLVGVEEITLEGDYTDRDGNAGEIPSVRLTCRRCNLQVEVYGTSEASVKRGCAMLREQCPSHPYGFYQPEDRA